MNRFAITHDQSPATMTDSTLIDTPEHTAKVPTDPLTILHSWAGKGWLRRLDSALAAFMLELDPTASPVLLVSTAVLAQMEGRGHTCLPLRLLVTQPDEVLAWPATAQDDLNALWQTLPSSLAEWLDSLRASPLVRSVSLAQGEDAVPDQADRGQPLVLGGTATEPLLYLRRYWLHECQVAAEVLHRTAASQAVDEDLAHQWLDRLFDPTVNEVSESQEVDWQKLACAVALRCLLYTSPSPRDKRQSRMPSSA